MRLGAMAAVVGCLSASAQAQTVVRDGIEVRTVAFRGAPAPGLPAGWTFRWFGYDVRCVGDSVAFSGKAEARDLPASPDQDAIWRVTPDDGAGILFSTHLSVPDAPEGSVFGRELIHWDLNDAGDFACVAAVSTPAANGTYGVYVFPHDAPGRAVVAEGVSPPGAGGLIVSRYYSRPVINPSGDVALAGIGYGIGDSAIGAFVASTSLGAAPVGAFVGQPTPGIPGGTFAGIDHNQVVDLADGGAIAFSAMIRLADGSERWTIYSNRDGDLAPVVRSDAAWVPPGLRVRWIHDPAMNNRGEIAFVAALEDGAGQWVASVLFAERYGVPTPILSADAIAGEPPTDGVATLTLIAMNDAGDVLLEGVVAGPAAYRRGLWLHSGGVLRCVAVEGGPAPGMTPGSTFGSVSGYSARLNRAGQVAFWTNARRPEGHNVNGVWLTDRCTGELRLVLVDGDLVAFNAQNDLTHVGRILGADLSDTGAVAIVSTPDGVFVARPLDACPADWNRDCDTNPQDFFDFANDYFAGTGPRGGSDFDGDGSVTEADFFGFVDAFFAPGQGC